MPGGRGEALFRAEMRASRDALEKAAQDASGAFLREKLGRVDWFVTLTFDRRAGRKPQLGPKGLGGPQILSASRLDDGRVRTIYAPSTGTSALELERVTPDKAMRAAAWWRRRLGVGIARHVAGVFAVEPHQLDASSHVHALVQLEGGPRDGDFQLAWFIWWSRYGYIKILRPKSEGDVCGYCGKYVTKDNGEWRLMGKRA